MVSLPINERSPFSVSKSTKDTMQATKKKKKYIALTVIGFGLTGFSAAKHSSSSGDGGIRASVVNFDGLLSSSVDPHSDWAGDNVCIPATGPWGGRSIRGSASPFETCYRNYFIEEECWSKSYFSTRDEWCECLPTPYKDWDFLNPGSASTTCGSACQNVVTYTSAASDNHIQ